MPSFEIIDHTADIGIAAYGIDLKEAFANAACGMFSLIIDPEEVGQGLCQEINIEAPDQEALLVAWLNELLYLFDAEHLVFTKFEIDILSQYLIRAKAYGEKIDLTRHHLKTEIKAATYHSLKIENENGFRIQVILDM